MYCRRCKKEVGGFHRCFNSLRTRNPIIPLKEKPDPNKTISHRLMKRLRKHPDLIIEEKATIERCYHSNNQKSAGAWAWSIENNGIMQIGSQYTMKDCLKAKQWTIYNHYGDTEIIPE